MIQFRRERVHNVWADLMPLLAEHWLEVAHYLDIPLDVDQEAYEQIEDAGALRVFTARDAAGVMFGYAVYFVRSNLHYRRSKQAVQDVLYVDPEHRGGLGIRMLKWNHEQLRAEGVQVVYQHVKRKPGLNFGPLLKRLGYEAIDDIYGLRLD